MIKLISNVYYILGIYKRHVFYQIRSHPDTSYMHCNFATVSSRVTVMEQPPNMPGADDRHHEQLRDATTHDASAAPAFTAANNVNHQSTVSSTKESHITLSQSAALPSSEQTALIQAAWKRNEQVPTLSIQEARIAAAKFTKLYSNTSKALYNNSRSNKLD